MGDLGSIPGLGRSPGEGKGYPLQYSGLEDSMDYIVHGVAKSRTGLSNVHFTCLSVKKEISHFALKMLPFIQLLLLGEILADACGAAEAGSSSSG